MLHEAPPVVPTSITCIGCGYDLSGTALGATCPECGRAVADTIAARTQPERSCSTATTCFVLGLLSLVVCGVLGPVAIGVYFAARKELDRGGYSKPSHTLARVGLILGIIATCLLGIYALFIFGAGVVGF